MTVRPRYRVTRGDNALCRCGHPYYRHFDTYEDMRPIGCKYCEDPPCPVFRAAGVTATEIAKGVRAMLVISAQERGVREDRANIRDVFDACWNYRMLPLEVSDAIANDTHHLTFWCEGLLFDASHSPGGDLWITYTDDDGTQRAIVL